ARRVNNPNTRPMPPNTSKKQAAYATGSGNPIETKYPVVPFSPYPPNQPKTFCAPWAKKMTPNVMRTAVIAQLGDVANSMDIHSPAATYEPQRVRVIAPERRRIRSWTHGIP